MKTNHSTKQPNERTVSHHAKEGKEIRQEDVQVMAIIPGHRAPVAGEMKGGIQ